MAYLLRNMQWKATIWILEAFQTSLSFSIQVIAGFILIHLYLQKISGRLQLRMQSLLPNHIIKSMLESIHSHTNNDYCLSLEKLTSKQQLKVKSSIVDTNNILNEIFHLFNPLSSKFSLENRLIDIFPSWFYFHLLDRKNTESKKAYIYKLNKLIL